MSYLGIDAGASATKWALVNEDGLIVAGICEPMDGHTYRQSSLDRMQKVLGDISKEVKHHNVSSVFMGITGVTNDGSIEKEINFVFHSKSVVVSDIELAYRANFDNGAGILLYAGTGSVAYAIDETATVHQIGGWGYLLGDEGAGYWIGKEAIRFTLFQIESKIEIANNSLAALILEKINAHDWNTVKAFVYSQDRSAIATLSKIVDSSAALGDYEAIAILKKAAEHLANLVGRMDVQLSRGSLPVKFTGGISGSKFLYRELEIILRERVSVSTIDIAQRAAELAR